MIKIEKITFDAATQRTKDINGFMRVERSHISKESVNPYRGAEVPGYIDLHLDPDKVYYGYRPGDELAKATATFNGLPLLFEHHVESAENPQKDFRVGSLGTDATWAAPYLDNSLIFTDQAAIDAVERGDYKELSAAYRYTPDFTPGEFQGIPYDFVMRNIVGNHVSIVSEGRAGPDVVVADSQIKERSSGMDKLMELAAEIKSVLGKFGIKEHPGAEEEAKMEIKDLPTTDEENVDGMATEKVTEDNEAGDAAAELFALIDTVNDKELAAKIKAAVQGMTGEKVTEDEDPEVEVKVEEKKEGELPAMDAKMVDKLVAAKIAASEARTKAKLDAARVVSPIIGEMVDPLAFDSAESIYKKALELQGINTKGYAPSAYRGMVDILRRNAALVVGMAQDSATSKETEENFKGLKNIRVAM